MHERSSGVFSAIFRKFSIFAMTTARGRSLRWLNSNQVVKVELSRYSEAVGPILTRSWCSARLPFLVWAIVFLVELHPGIGYFRQNVKNVENDENCMNLWFTAFYEPNFEHFRFSPGWELERFLRSQNTNASSKLRWTIFCWYGGDFDPQFEPNYRTTAHTTSPVMPSSFSSNT